MQGQPANSLPKILNIIIPKVRQVMRLLYCPIICAYITSLRNLRVEDYVHKYYSVQMFKDAYQFEVNSMGDKSQWPTIDLGFEMRPPKLERPAGRSKKKRIKSSGEAGKRRPYQCKRCFQYGHIEKSCTNPVLELDEDILEAPPTRKKGTGGSAAQQDTHAKKKESRKKKKDQEQASTSTHAIATSPSSPGPLTRRRATRSPSCSSPSATTQAGTTPCKRG
uniref:CCHC-type domain-containing protein n=1 Tax=Arundo donax TaxID=35708 RepID=A0A0A9DPP8_ARUDO